MDFGSYDLGSLRALIRVAWVASFDSGRPPLARHRHRNCDEFLMVLKGRGHIDGEKGEEPAGEGDVVFWPRGAWHGFHNSSDDDVVLIWGWIGAGSVEASGTEMAAAQP